jgi:hypothetical protein
MSRLSVATATHEERTHHASRQRLARAPLRTTMHALCSCYTTAVCRYTANGTRTRLWRAVPLLLGTKEPWRPRCIRNTTTRTMVFQWENGTSRHFQRRIQTLI